MPARSILFVSVMNGSAWGGSEQLWSRAAAFAARDGLRVTCAVNAWDAKRPRLAALREAGCEVIELPNAGRERRTLRERLEHALLTRPRRRAAFARLPVESHELVVINQGGWDEAAAAEVTPLAARLRRYALTFHSYRESPRFSRPRTERLRRLLLGASANLFAARRIQAVLEAELGIAIPNARVLLNPIGFEPGPPIAPPVPPPWRLAVLAALDVATKRQDVLLEVLARAEWRDRDVEVELWGEGPDAAALRASVVRLGLEGRVHLRGHTADPRGAIANAHLVLQLTQRDAMPITVMEAMALGRPVAVTRVGDMPEWVEDDVAGFVCERATPEAVAATLERAWARRESWSRMGAAARVAFESRYPASVERHFLEQVDA